MADVAGRGGDPQSASRENMGQGVVKFKEGQGVVKLKLQSPLHESDNP